MVKKENELRKSLFSIDFFKCQFLHWMSEDKTKQEKSHKDRNANKVLSKNQTRIKSDGKLMNKTLFWKHFEIQPAMLTM